jgi:hypothetical protein
MGSGIFFWPYFLPRNELKVSGTFVLTVTENPRRPAGKKECNFLLKRIVKGQDFQEQNHA